MKILVPHCDTKAYHIAAEIFADMTKQLTGESLEIISEAVPKESLVVIGSDAVNGYLSNAILEGKLPELPLTAATDDYLIQSVELEGRRVLLLCGGRGRSTIYAVYRYFEAFCDCGYFWDGDVLPQRKALPMENIYLLQKQRFQYRGIRYFAHRGLTRFRAEHWGFDEWKKEIDWLAKKGINLMMLRFGNDDLYQKAFPDIVDYPPNEGYLFGDKPGYWDTTPSWSLKFRGELRKQILDYAFDREMLHPDDCGTLTHWYSQTPQAFLDTVKPKIVGSFKETEASSMIWDVREEENIRNYFCLTKAHIENYGKGELFHTIGFAEHSADNDPRKNMYLKTFMYKKTLEYKNQLNSNAPLLLACWDFWNNQNADEVTKLLENFHDSNVILLDYTSDTAVENRNFTQWGILGKMPYTFGMFHGFSSQTEIMENYDLTEKRLKTAVEDNACCGMIYWPELSHGDTFSLEYFADQTRNPLSLSMKERITRFCQSRYGNHPEMKSIWQAMLKLSELFSWSSSKNQANTHFFETVLDLPYWIQSLQRRGTFLTEEYCTGGYDLEALFDMKEEMAGLLERLATISFDNCEFLRRDIYDMARTIIYRYLVYMIYSTVLYFYRGKYQIAADLEYYRKPTTALLTVWRDLLGQHEDYSMRLTFEKLHQISEVNPVYEHTIKKNAESYYNRTHIYELARYFYLPETNRFFDFLMENAGNQLNKLQGVEELIHWQSEHSAEYYHTPLAEMIPPESAPFGQLVCRAAKIIRSIEKIDG